MTIEHAWNEAGAHHDAEAGAQEAYAEHTRYVVAKRTELAAALAEVEHGIWRVRGELAALAEYDCAGECCSLPMVDIAAHLASAARGLGAARALVSPVEQLLADAAALLTPCPVPQAADGFDACAHGAWPCRGTEVAWRLRGIDPDAERARLLRAAREEMLQRAAEAGW